MHKKLIYTAVVAAVMSAPQVSAAKIELSEAFNYNAFIFEDYEGERSDVEGSLAVGGNLTVEDFDVGLLLPTDLSSSALYVGGDLSYTRGHVHAGQTTVSGMVTANGVMFDGALNSGSTTTVTYGSVENGGIFSEGDVTLEKAGVNNGDIQSEQAVTIREAGVNGSITYGTTLTVDNAGYTGSAVQSSSNTVNVDNLDFNSIANEVTAQSQDFASMSVNGTTTLTCTDASDPNALVSCNDSNIDTLDTIVFSGSDDVNIYSISSDWFSAADKDIVYDFSTTSYNIINVYGDTVELFNTGFFNTAFTQENEYFTENGQYRDNDNNIGQRHDGLYTNNILFNFVDAEDLTLHSVGVKGSVLAPYAELSFYNGHVDGNVIANSLVTPLVELVNDQGQTYNAPTGQINNYQFGAINVSEPASIALLFGAGCFMLVRRRQVSKV
ncbi:choice-of-anchor A family protein [Alteromonas sp. PRIM-21]|uniref:choice-of-anchor A family protein n=1 Tax=Alteromonas sp. PRIM-21 TaxID=1454978 RepID=UPI0022B9921E|nr:choice-of-anchor A family protein [Alteromonas sp. PRIM-21]MCZ8530873.1 choice-of-anchor A family protein [Alteromonas sp. PRIM-21]